MSSVAILFARSDSVYKELPGCDVWDIGRDALNWCGGAPVVAHPPCRAWGCLRHFAKPGFGEKGLAIWAVARVRENGGVLEHPLASTLWPIGGLPPPGRVDDFGGWTLPVDQHWWGHPGRKRTLLYIVGCAPRGIPLIPFSISQPVQAVEDLSKKGREATPPAFAEWLVDLARKCAVS